MTVNKFIEGYSKSTNKENYIKKHIINNYVSLSLKINDCERIVQNSCYINVENNKVFVKNSVLRYLLFISNLLIRYTDIEISDDVIPSLDILMSKDVLNLIINNIPQSEYTDYNTLLNMKLDDIESMESNLNITLKNFIIDSNNNILNILNNMDKEKNND